MKELCCCKCIRWYIVNRKITIFIIVKISLITILMVNTTSIQAADRSWHAGEVYFFGYSYDIQAIYQSDSPELHRTTHSSTDLQYSYNITGVDLLTERYRAIYADDSGTDPISSHGFVWEDFVEHYLDNLISVTYVWDYEHNSTVLVGYSLSYSTWNFIEPQWDMINSEFADTIFNTSDIIATVDDPYLPIIHNITLGTFLNSTNTYSIMGKDNLEDAKLKFTEKTTNWFYEFDLTGVMMLGIYNSTLGYNLYHPYEKATISYDIEYTKGGVLNRYQLNGYSNCTYTDYMSEYSMSQLTVLGGVKSLEGNFPFLVIFPAIFFVAIFARKIKQENNRRVR